MNRTLTHKRALVTGGSRGIGAAIVKRLAGEGAHVALTYVSKPDEANQTAAAAKAMGVNALAIQADSARPEAVVAAVERTVQEFGGIDIMVNNPATGEFAEMLKKVMALPRYAHADEIAAMVAYLAGPEAGFVTGASLTIDGGFTS